MEADQIANAGAGAADAGALADTIDVAPAAASDEWPYEPTPLPTPPQEAETTTDTAATDADDDEDGLTDEDVATATTDEPPAADAAPPPSDEPPAEKPLTRAERIAQRAIEKYRESPEYQAEIERQAEARREVERLEAQAAAEREANERQRTESQAEVDRRLGKYLGRVKDADGRTEYERDLAFLASKRAEVEDSEDEDTYVSPELKRQIQAAKARVARVEENRQMADTINDLAWAGIAADYESALAFPEIAGLDQDTRAAIARPRTLRDGLALLRTHLLAGATRTHQQEVEQLKAAHATEVKALKADLAGWQARAAGAGGTPETRTQPTSSGGLTLERYQRMTPDEAADLTPAEIDRMWQNVAAMRQAAAR